MFLYQFGESHVILNLVFLRNILTKFKSLGRKKRKHVQLHTQQHLSSPYQGSQEQ